MLVAGLSADGNAVRTMSLLQLAADGAVFVVDALTNRQAFGTFLHALASKYELHGEITPRHRSIALDDHACGC